ncbi:MAG: arginase family protein [Hyphomicrobiales bacterium]
MTILINAQWQGNGNGHRYPIGAERIRNMLGANNTITPDISYVGGSSEIVDGVRDQCELSNSLTMVDEVLTANDWDEPLFNLGCDCGGELIPIAKLNQKYEGNLRVIWFDAHPDLNTTESSGSHTFHGMVLRALLGDIPKSFSKHLPVKLAPENVILAGIRDIDNEEQEYIDKHELDVIEPSKLTQPPTQERVAVLSDAPVFIHLDYDILDPKLHKSTAFVSENGVSLKNLIAWIRFIRGNYNVVGYGLTEFAPSSILSNDGDIKQLLNEGFGLDLVGGDDLIQSSI